MAIAISVATSGPARAASAECEQLVRQAVAWLSRAATSGGPSSVLEQLRNLGPSLIGCDQDEPAVPGTGENDPERWRRLAGLYFDAEDVDRAICLMGKESAGDPDARNPSTGAAGLMQVMPFWAETHGYAYDDLFDPGINLWVASQIRDQQGWSAWSPYLRGECR